MYVDKKLGGVNAVQTLSRLNRTYPDKGETTVLDFANEADDILKAFTPYYEQTILSEKTDPNYLYDLEHQLADFQVYGKSDLDSFAGLWFGPPVSTDRLYAALAPSRERFLKLGKEEREDFRSLLVDYVRIYAFLSQVLTFTDADLEKLYVFARMLARYLPIERDSLPRDIQQKIDMESYRIQKRFNGKIKLDRGNGQVKAIWKGGSHSTDVPEMEILSAIIKALNERFGTDFTDEDKVFIETLERQLADNDALAASVRVNTPDNARLTFDHIVTDSLQDMVDTNFKFYKRVTDDREFSKFFLDWLFQRFRENLEKM